SVNIEVPVASKKKITSTKYGETIDAASLILGTTTLKPTSWSSSKSSVASIDAATGEITTAGRGSTKITAYYGEGKNAAKVSMTLKVNIPKLSKTSLTIKTGKTKKLSLKNAGGWSVTWGSLDRTVATVDGYGRVSAVAPGYTTVYAEVDGVRYECMVLVR
ncbi:MAG: Ig-like domain-containing protein, partial [Lachnospiraceae bacterium]|nr:Ig-like domain-containing protein [Lachnospiraceae bacterium]